MATDGDAIDRAGLLAALAARAAELRMLSRMLGSSKSVETAGQLDASIGEVEWLAALVATWRSPAPAGEGGADGGYI
jgi:hypothetical protein